MKKKNLVHQSLFVVISCVGSGSNDSESTTDELIENADALTIDQYASYFQSTDTSSTGSSFAGFD